MLDMGFNNLVWSNPNMRHPSDSDLEMAAAAAGTDSPWLEQWSREGGMNNILWASGLEHLVYKNHVLDQTCGLGVVVHDPFGWRATGILSQCGHPILIHANPEVLQKYLNELPFECHYCKTAMENKN